MLVGTLEDFHSAGTVVGHSSGEEASAGTKAEFGGAEGVFHRTVGRRLGDETAWRCRTILTLGESVDTVVEQYHVEVDIAAHGVDEVVASDGQSVAVAANLPYGEVGIHYLGTGGNGCRTSVDGLHGIGVDVIGQTAGAAYAADYCRLIGRNAQFGHGFVQTGQEEMVATSRAPSWLPFLVIVGCIFVHNDFC